MKNILSLGISGKKIANKKFLTFTKFNFCYGNKISFTNMENEIMKSFTSLNKSFNLNGNKKTIPDQSEEDKSFTLSMLKDKYLNQDSQNDIDNIIKAIFREEVLNIKKEKEYESLILFIKNCKKYNYPAYLTDVKFFKNKDIKNFMTNTSLLESLNQKQSPFSLENEFRMKFKVQQLYKLRKGEKGEKLDRITEKEFEIEKYDYMNYLAETSTIEKITNLNKINKNNEKVLNEFHSKNNILEKEEDVDIKQEAWKNHYIQYLQKMKKNERKESMGASKYEEPYYYEAIKKNANQIFNETKSSLINETEDNEDDDKETIAGGESRRYTQNDAKAMNDGANEPFAYHDVDDYPIEEFLDTDLTAPGAECLVYGSLREVGKYELLPPKIDNYFDNFVVDTHMWGLFASNLNSGVAIGNIKLGLKNILQDILIRNTNSNGQRANIGDSFNTDMPQSLIHYYNLLPKWARDHPAIKMLIRGLEFYQPWITYREKINLINIGLKFIIQRDRKYIEIYEEIYQSVPENITLENLPSLMEYNDDTERNILQHPDDEATDDEEFEFFQSAEEVRVIEKQEEEERKMKKKEEGRAKRAAEEAKQAASEGKVDKSAEEKKKKEDAEKKKKETEGADEEEGGKDEEGDEESQARAEDESLKEEKMFSPNKKYRKDEDEKGDELMSIYDALHKKIRGEAAEKDGNEDLDKENDEDLDADNSEDSKTLKEEKEGMENFRKTYREKKGIVQGKKNKIHDIINDLRSSETLKIFEDNVQLLRKNLEENNIRFMQKKAQEKIMNTKGSTVETTDQFSKLAEIDQSNDLIVFPMTLLSSSRLNEDQKLIIKSTFSPYINQLSDKNIKDVTIELDENISKKTIEEAEYEILNKISLYESDLQEKSEGIDVSLEYKDSLRDDDLKVDESEELGLTDAYYKPRLPIDYFYRKEDPIPLDYYINEDGFWNDYIAFHKSKVDVKQITIKPFIHIRKQLKKKEQI